MTPYYQDSTVTIYHGRAEEVLPTLEPVDLTVTSPPYDNLRTYNGYTFDFEIIAKELYRVTKPGGVIVWVVGDATIDGSETGTSFRQALYFKDVCEFNLHDTMIYQSDRQPVNNNRYEPKFEYMFVLSKGKPKTWNPIMESSLYAGARCSPKEYNQDGSKKEWWGDGVVKDTKVKGNVWYIPTGAHKSTMDNVAHPAIFPEALANDHIRSWSNPGDIILDPMCGSGTVGKMARKNGCRFIGIDVSEEYCQITVQRLAQQVMPFDPSAPVEQEVGLFEENL